MRFQWLDTKEDIQRAFDEVGRALEELRSRPYGQVRLNASWSVPYSSHQVVGNVTYTAPKSGVYLCVWSITGFTTASGWGGLSGGVFRNRTLQAPLVSMIEGQVSCAGNIILWANAGDTLSLGAAKWNNAGNCDLSTNHCFLAAIYQGVL